MWIIFKNISSFIDHCLQPTGDFLNYVDKDGKFTAQNKTIIWMMQMEGLSGL